MIDLTGTAPPWPEVALKQWEQAMREALASEGVWRGPPYAGEMSLRGILADLLGEPAEQILITMGVRAACFRIPGAGAAQLWWEPGATRRKAARST
jgi:DNA-binding transcriptional MocR family regulator